ncbi:MAG: ATP synthase F0 subunit B [Clostridiales bacterium]|jgi:F-type H+-transporting ATPase subunit b|nr:ATP synthase F0 subunit B [Clostridiales bacterium]
MKLLLVNIYAAGIGELFERLDLTWGGMAFYALNLAALVAGLYFLLFKPVKKMVEKRRAELTGVYEENDRLLREANELKATYESTLEESKTIAAKITADALQGAQSRGDLLVAQAKLHADEIVAAAEAEAAAERVRLQGDIKREIVEVSVSVAEAILSRELQVADNDQLIDEAVKEWQRK